MFKSRISILILCLFFLSGCTNKLLYSFADWWVIWKVDDYFDISDSQETFLEEKLAIHLDWHRKEELGVYVTVLKSLRERMQDGLSEQDVDWIYQTADGLRKNLIRHVAKDISTFLATLSPSQIDYLESKLPEFNESTKKRLALSKKENLERRVENTIEEFEDLVGYLTEEQRQKITELSNQIPSSLKERLAYREKSQKAFINLLRTKRDAQAIEEQLLFWQMDLSNLHTPEYAAVLAKQRIAVKKMIVEVDKMLTVEQRQYLFKTFDEFVTDLEDIQSS